MKAKKEMTLKEFQMKGGNANTPAQQAARRENMRKLNERKRLAKLQKEEGQ